MNNPQIKYRPSLTIQQIERLLTLLDPVIDTDLLSQLNKFRLKAMHGISTPSHVTMPRQSIEESFGFDSVQTTSEASIESLLTIFSTAPQTLSQSQLKTINLHRYTNDLMTAEEESAYESSSH